VWRKASALWLQFSQFLARRGSDRARRRCAQRSKRMGAMTKPFARLLRLTISIAKPGMTLAIPSWKVDFSSYPLSSENQDAAPVPGNHITDQLTFVEPTRARPLPPRRPSAPRPVPRLCRSPIAIPTADPARTSQAGSAGSDRTRDPELDLNEDHFEPDSHLEEQRKCPARWPHR
jgi:hypothetical protein